MNLQKILQEQFQLESFREGQEQIIKSVISGSDTLVFMPTGGGKSLTYQLPGVVRTGLVMVISPLISLMKDQVDKLNHLGIRAELINSTITAREQQMILDELSVTDYNIPLNGGGGKGGVIKFLYIAPERLNSDVFLRIISHIPIALVAIDEAHCISQWGHDFRPSYMKIKGFIEKLETSPHSISLGKGPHPSPLLRGEGMVGIRENYKEVPDYIKELSKDLRKYGTDSEGILWEVLRNRKYEGIKFRRQHAFGRYIADFYSDELKLVIELDGKIHENQEEYDKLRDEIIGQYGVEVLRCKNEEVYSDLSGIFEKISPYASSPLRRGLRGGGKERQGDYEAGIKRTFPIMALTATATKKVRADIVARLGLQKYTTFISGFDRKNIIIIVRELSKKEEKLSKLQEILMHTPGSGIIYCSSRKVTKEVFDELVTKGESVAMYTGEMNPHEREQVQNDFMSGNIRVMVATNAFGMGIDKKDIRFVVHYNLPGSIENYYQEVGRAGRDGKKSYGVVLASYGDTKIQEFFIENTYPKKEEVFQLYEYLYSFDQSPHPNPLLRSNFEDSRASTPVSLISSGERENIPPSPYKGEGSGGWGKAILKTYYQIASESGLQNDMKVGSIVKLLEKYGIIKRGYEGSDIDDFRGRGITLLQEKRKTSELLIDWKHQNLLKEEAYYKLDEIKKLLFQPQCRKRYILEYFGDEEDLQNLGASCGVCDYCLEKRQFESGDVEKLVPLSVFGIALDVVGQFDKRFGITVISNFLRGSEEKKILEWGLDSKKNYGIFSDYTGDLIIAILEALLRYGFLEKTTGQYPVIGLSKIGRVALKREDLIKEDESNLQSFISMKCKNQKQKKGKQGKTKSPTKSEGNTYEETLKLLQLGKSIVDIITIRGMTNQTIEGHVVELYTQGRLGLADMLKLVRFSHLNEVKRVIQDTFGGDIEKLKPIKEQLEFEEKKDVSYFEIKVAIAMMERGDL